MMSTRSGLIAAGLILAALALWWRWGLAVILAGPGWLCLPR
jgi:hypothetical protein